LEFLDPYIGRAADYAAFRPPYAREAIDDLCELASLSPQSIVADIGAGTGNVTRHLVARVATVFAIEPSAEMRQQAESLLGAWPSFRSVAATAEATTLPDRSVDVIVAGQSLHWFQPQLALAEFGRILRPEGWLAAIWNDFGGEEGGDHEGGDVGRFLPACIRRRYSVTVRETWDEYLGGLRSAAWAPSPGQPSYTEFVASHRRGFDARALDGRIDMPYATELAVGRLEAPMP